MKTKNYLLVAVSSALLLLLVVPLLNGPWWISSGAVASIIALSTISIAVGGLTAETYAIAIGRKATDFSLTDARKYFMSLASSLFFLLIVAPSIQSVFFGSVSPEGIVTVSVLFVLTIALAGLATQGLFSAISGTPLGKDVLGTNSPQYSFPRTSQHTETNPGAVEELDSRFAALDSTMNTRLQEMKHQLLGAIYDTSERARPSTGIEMDTIASSPSANVVASTQPEKLLPHPQTSPTKDQVVEALLGKSKGGGN